MTIALQRRVLARAAMLSRRLPHDAAWRGWKTSAFPAKRWDGELKLASLRLP